MLHLRRRSSGAGSYGVWIAGVAVLAGASFGLAGCAVDRVTFQPEDSVQLVVSDTELAVLEGETATFTVALSARPKGPIDVTLSSGSDMKVEGAPGVLRFEPDGFDVPQTVTVTGKTDRDANNEASTILVESAGLESVTVAVSVVECPTLAAQDFWVMFNPNADPSGRRDLIIAGANGTTVKIADGNSLAIPESGLLVVDTGLTRVPAAGQVESGKAFQVTASAPVQVFANNFRSASVDAFTVLPVQLLGTDYRAIGYPNSLTGQMAQISVYATEDATTVTIGAGAPILLNRGQSYLHAVINTGNPAVDLTGTRVLADKPVAVNSGDACLNTGAGACDHVEEMLFPVTSWSSDFFVPALPQDQAFRVVAATAGTMVTVDGQVVATLDAGQFYAGTGGGKRVQTSQPAQLYVIALGQADVNGDPAFLLLPGVQNAVDGATFSALSDTNTNFLVVSMPTAAIASLRLDGAPVETRWTPYASGGYSHAQVTITAGTHKLTADDVFIPVVWGERTAESYAYVAGYGYPKQRCQLP